MEHNKNNIVSDDFKNKSLNFKSSLDITSLISKLIGHKSQKSIASEGDNLATPDEPGMVLRKSKTKDAQFTTINPGQIKSLQRNDSTSDILGKIYNFMRKSTDEKTKHLELEKSFRQEQLDEDERRHSRLISAITGKTKNNVTLTENKSTNVDSNGGFLESILSIVDSIKNNFFIKKILNLKNLAALVDLLIPFIRIAGPISAIAVAAYGAAKLGEWLRDKLNSFIHGKMLETGGPEALKALKRKEDNNANNNLTLDESGSLDESVNAEENKTIEYSQKRKTYLVDNYLRKGGYKPQQKTIFGFGIPGSTKYEDAAGNEVTKDVMNSARSWADERMSKDNNAGTTLDRTFEKMTSTKVDVNKTSNPTDVNTNITTPVKTTIPPIKPIDKVEQRSNIDNVSVNNNLVRKQGKNNKIINLSSVKQRNSDLKQYDYSNFVVY